jgi:CRP-like cAMP-binding protein
MAYELRKYLESFISFTEEEWTILSESFQPMRVDKKTHLTELGQREKYMYFVVKGLVRLYCMNTKAETATTFFFRENHFASCYDSFLNGSPSSQALETLEDCILLAIRKEQFDLIHEQLPKLSRLTREITDQRFINTQRIFMSYITQTPEQRYLSFEKYNADLLLRVPQHIIASFLGMTPVSLSRIRNRLMKK